MVQIVCRTILTARFELGFHALVHGLDCFVSMKMYVDKCPYIVIRLQMFVVERFECVISAN